MEEKQLISLWNEKRSQIIAAQMAPALVLIAILVTASFGKFMGASHAVQYLAIGVAAATGILALISQYAAIREASSLAADLRKIDKKSALGKKISESESFLQLTTLAMVGLSAAVFALVIWAVLVK